MPPRIRKASRLDKLTPRHLKGREQTVKPATPGTTEQTAQEEVRQIAGELDALCRRLEGVHKRLPVASNEAVMLLGEADMDVATWSCPGFVDTSPLEKIGVVERSP